MIKFLKNSIVVAFLFFCFFLPRSSAPSGWYRGAFLSPVSAQTKVEFDFFFSPTCPHCTEEEKFLDKLAVEFPEVNIVRYNVQERKNVDLLLTFYDRYSVPQDQRGQTPSNFIDGGDKGQKYFIGYSTSVDPIVKNYLNELLGNTGNINNDNGQTASSTGGDAALNGSGSFRSVSLPFIGKVELKNLSPLLLTVVVGILDGFNACAMIALFFLLASLIGSGDRKKVILIGGIFIFVSGLVYFLFISAWLNLFMFLQYYKIISLIVAVVIIVFSFFLLEDYFYDVICKICHVKENEKEKITTVWQRKLLAYMANISSLEKSLWVTILGVSLVAAGINTIELFCSFGFPMAYTKILTSFNLPRWSYYGYLLIYIFFYMLDDLLVFLAAVLTMRVTKASDKYLKFVKLISGVVLLILGVLMVFKPELLSLK